MPGLKVAYLASPDAQQDSQHLDAPHALRQLRVQTCATLLNESEVKTCRIGDGLQERFDQISVSARNSGVLANRQGGDVFAIACCCVVPRLGDCAHYQCVGRC